VLLSFTLVLLLHVPRGADAAEQTGGSARPSRRLYESVWGRANVAGAGQTTVLARGAFFIFSISLARLYAHRAVLMEKGSPVSRNLLKPGRQFPRAPLPSFRPRTPMTPTSPSTRFGRHTPPVLAHRLNPPQVGRRDLSSRACRGISSVCRGGRRLMSVPSHPPAGVPRPLVFPAVIEAGCFSPLFFLFFGSWTLSPTADLTICNWRRTANPRSRHRHGSA